MVAIFLTILISFFIASLFGYIIHWALHQTWTGRLNQKHMTHHLILYPPEDYTSDIYRDSGKNNTLFTFLWAALPIVGILLTCGLSGILSWLLVIASAATIAIFGFLSNYLHDSFHIKKHWLYNNILTRTLFKRWSYLHYQHHCDMSKNFGIFFFGWDRVLRTFLK